ncbi:MULTISPECIES: DUF6415 family natural product biosynthesis protein [Streptomyces]|uniref:Uncharacterized protein n=1 Tax=Streptomyces luteosporeus TaxID=173856 RepID=A0ABP6G7K0_9ACTN
MTTTIARAQRQAAGQPPSRWMPPTTENARRLLAALQSWQPLNVDAVFDDLNAILGDQAPAVDEVDELADRLRGHLMQLVNIALANAQSEVALASAHGAVEQGRVVGSEELPGDYRKALGLLRRLALATEALVELLISAKWIKDAD